MERIRSIDKIPESVSEIKSLRKGFITNFYLDNFKHTIWVQRGILWKETIDDTVFFIKKNNHFWNVFYNTTNIVSLNKALNVFETKYSKEMIIFDVIGNIATCDAIKNTFINNQYHHICTLIRMSRLTPVGTYYRSYKSIRYANQDDTKEVAALLKCFFDSKTEQIPYYEELIEYSKQNRILVYIDQGKVVGFVVFEMNRSTLYLRYWFVLPEYRDKKVGSMLLKSFFEEGKDTRRQLFWVIVDNDNAIKRYKHYGFKAEDMYDYVFTNK